MLEGSNLLRAGLQGWGVGTGSWIDQAVIQEDELVNEMDRFWFNLNWYLYRLRAWWHRA